MNDEFEGELLGGETVNYLGGGGGGGAGQAPRDKLPGKSYYFSGAERWFSAF